jgi:hypothetical protein
VSESIVDALAVPGNAVVTGTATELQSDQERLLPPAVSGAETPTNDGSRRRICDRPAPPVDADTPLLRVLPASWLTRAAPQRDAAPGP